MKLFSVGIFEIRPRSQSPISSHLVSVGRSARNAFSRWQGQDGEQHTSCIRTCYRISDRQAPSLPIWIRQDREQLSAYHITNHPHPHSLTPSFSFLEEKQTRCLGGQGQSNLHSSHVVRIFRFMPLKGNKTR